MKKVLSWQLALKSRILKSVSFCFVLLRNDQLANSTGYKAFTALGIIRKGVERKVENTTLPF